MRATDRSHNSSLAQPSHTLPVHSTAHIHFRQPTIPAMDPRLVKKFVSPIPGHRHQTGSSGSHISLSKRKLPDFVPDSSSDNEDEPPTKHIRTPQRPPYTFGVGASQPIDADDMPRVASTQYDSPVVIGPSRGILGRSMGGGLMPRNGYGMGPSRVEEVEESYWMVQW